MPLGFWRTSTKSDPMKPVKKKVQELAVHRRLKKKKEQLFASGPPCSNVQPRVWITTAIITPCWLGTQLLLPWICSLLRRVNLSHPVLWQLKEIMHTKLIFWADDIKITWIFYYHNGFSIHFWHVSKYATKEVAFLKKILVSLHTLRRTLYEMLTGEDGTLAKFQLGDSVYQWSAFFSKECREICRADTRAEDTFANTLCSSLVYPLFNMDSIHQSKERWAPYLSATHFFCSPLLLILLTSINTAVLPWTLGYGYFKYPRNRVSTRNNYQ